MQSGVTIGHDDFAYAKDESGKLVMIKHHGGVNIGNDVYLGCNTIINRGTIDDTIIKDRCKVDVNNFISHNCVVNEDCMLVTGNNIYGSVVIGQNAYIAGSCTVRNGLKIGEHSFIGMGSVVIKDVEKNTTVVGNPAKLYNKK